MWRFLKASDLLASPAKGASSVDNVRQKVTQWLNYLLPIYKPKHLCHHGLKLLIHIKSKPHSMQLLKSPNRLRDKWKEILQVELGITMRKCQERLSMMQCISIHNKLQSMSMIYLTVTVCDLHHSSGVACSLVTLSQLSQEAWWQSPEDM